MNIVKQMRNLRNVGAAVSMTALGGAAVYEKNVHPAFGISIIVGGLLGGVASCLSGVRSCLRHRRLTLNP